jgi:type II secretory pathway component PulF
VPDFRYKGVSDTGEELSGRIQAARATSAHALLSDRNIVVYELTEETAQVRKLKTRKPKSQDFFEFMQQLAVLIRSGIPMLDALVSLRRVVGHQIIADQLDELIALLRSGMSLSEGLAKTFPQLPASVPSLVKLGEATGELPQTLNVIAEQLKFAEDLKSDLRGALTYPAFLLVVGIFAVLFMLLFVVPNFEGMIGDELDTMTGLPKIVFSASAGLRTHGLLMLLGVAGAVGALIWGLRDRRGRERLLGYAFAIPIVGPLLRKKELADWTRTVGLSLSARANLLDAVVLARSAVVSAKSRAGFDDVARDLRAGMTLEQALDKVPGLEPIVLNLVAVGTKAGNLGEMLLLATDILDGNVRSGSQRLGKLAEPVAILLISAIVGVVVISLVTAMTSIYDTGLT